MRIRNHFGRLKTTFAQADASEGYLPQTRSLPITFPRKGKLSLEMKRLVIISLAISLLLAATSNSFGQATDNGTAQQSRVVGVVTAVDNAAGSITIKNDAGEAITINTNATSSVLRLPPGETSAQKAAKIALTDIAVGDRLFARGTLTTDQKAMAAKQVVVTGGAVAAGNAQDEQRQREEFRQRGLMGRITALNADKKEITVQSRGREGTGPITVSASDATRFFRYAPDSLDIKNASRVSFSELRVGDQLRALGSRNSDGTQFTAEEIIAGSMARTVGQVVAINPAKNEITIKNNQGQNITVAIGARSSLRRVTPEAAASLEASRPARPAGDGQRRGGQTRTEGAPRERRDGVARGAGGGGEGNRRGGRGFQDMLQSLPAITVSDLKKGDTVFVSGSEGADPSHVTAIMLVTGDPAFMSRLTQTGPNRGPQNPGLPGDVMGGGVGSAERPPNP
jgi:preprotein translocase subunit YajC